VAAASGYCELKMYIYMQSTEAAVTLHEQLIVRDRPIIIN